MDIFGVLQMLGGLCLFLFGMETMGDGLTKASGNKLEKILGSLTSSVPSRAGVRPYTSPCGVCRALCFW